MLLNVLYQQHLQSSRQNSQPSKQIDRSFLSLGSKPFRLKLSRCCLSYLDGALVRRQRLFQALLATALVHNLLFL